MRAPTISEPHPPPRFEGSRGMNQKVGLDQPVTATKANLVRAAIKAGVKPSALARQFGLSRAAIREVLKSGEG